MKFLYYVFTFLSLNCFAQKESSIWYFGDKAGIQFEDNGTVSVLTDSQMSTNEGCATISDSSGNLLFYSNGEKIWNKNHVIMQNGSDLLGSANSSQAVIIAQVVEGLFQKMELEYLEWVLMILQEHMVVALMSILKH